MGRGPGAVVNSSLVSGLPSAPAGGFAAGGRAQEEDSSLRGGMEEH